jgi:hypothetical protein
VVYRQTTKGGVEAELFYIFLIFLKSFFRCVQLRSFLVLAHASSANEVRKTGILARRCVSQRWGFGAHHNLHTTGPIS